MNIAITATQPSLEAKVEPRFGRCPYFLIVDTDTLDFEAIENPNTMLGGGAGIQSAQLMAERNVKHVLTGNCGPNAYQTLSAAGVSVIIGCSGTISDVVEQFRTGQFSAADQPNVASKSGMAGAPNPAADPSAGLQQPSTMTPGGIDMGQGRGGGMGQGGGGGMGRGAGRGMGQGRGGGRGMGGGMGQGMGQSGGGGMGAGFVQGADAMPQQPTQPLTKNDELAMLKQQAEFMTQQTQQIQQRIDELEKEKNRGSQG